MYMKAIFHIHTKYSFDSILSPKKIVDLAWKNKINFVFITDHNTIHGALEAKEYAKKNKIPVDVIIGEEVATDVGDIIGIFLKRNIKSRDYKKVMNEIRKQGGMAVLPHPLVSHDIEKISKFKNIDFVEVWNSRTSEKNEINVEKLIEKLDSKPIVGSDAHLTNEIFNSLILFESINEFKKGKIKFRIIKKSNKFNKIISLVFKKLKGLT